MVVDRQHAGRAHQQRVAIGRGLGHQLRADIAAGAGPVVDQERLLELLRELLGNDARDHIGGPASGKRHHDAHRLVGVAVVRGGGVCGVGQAWQDSKQYCAQADQALHLGVLWGREKWHFASIATQYSAVVEAKFYGPLLIWTNEFD
ncbi:hypothetical protein CS8_063060 [Cupriavidus sp. 8B]